MKRRNRRGFTLIEVLVAITIMGMILPLVGTALYQFIKVPPEETHELTAINDVSLAFQWIADDASRALAFFPGVLPGEYGTFFWRDHATDISYSVFYEYDDANDELVRTEVVENEPVPSLPVAYHIVNEGDVSFTPIGDRLIKIYILSSVPHMGGYRTDDGTAFVFLNAESHIFDYTVLAAGRVGKSIDISGNDVTIRGDIRVNGNIEVSSGQHRLQDGEVYLPPPGYLPPPEEDEKVGEYTVGPNSRYDSVSHPEGWPWPDNPEAGVNRVPELKVDWPFDEYDFLPYLPGDDDWGAWVAGEHPNHFIFDENMVDLKSYPEIWQDEDETVLKDGIYYNQRAGGTIRINEDVTGRVTLISDYIAITAGDAYLSPFAEGVILYGTGTGSDVIKTAVSGGSWSGILYAPDGEVNMSGSNFVLYGFMMAQYLHLSGSGGGLIIVFM